MPEWLEKLAKYQMRFVMITTLMSIGVLIFSWTRLPPEVPMLYNNPWGQEQLVSRIWLWALPIISLFINLATFVISKKVSKLATTRNRSKRRARAVWRSLLEGDYKNVAQSSHLLIVIHRSLVNVTPKEIYVEAEGLLRQLSRRLRP